ncbi:CoA transferase [Bradyrhizobium sp. LTSP849]|uniref:CoA transferase n=1 Tax=Bradyrhizobium sp. LTSP849 TaxID=1615890 RepID=UPI0005D25239|nr:CoA transferase [Bradyrhizobium sp. LTSP849]
MKEDQLNLDAIKALDELIRPAGLNLEDVGGSVSIYGADPLFPSAVRMGEAFSIAAMAAAIGPAAIWKERTGQGQHLSIDVRKAAHGINPDMTFHPTINGHPYPDWVGNRHPFGAYPYKTKDGRWVYPSGVYPHQQTKWGNFFNCGTDFEHIRAAIAKWDAEELEDAANEKGLTLCMVRTTEEWLQHPQGMYLSNEPVIAIRKIAESAPEPFSPANRPLEGIKVLSLTHAIAGPVVGRTLAEQGADVLCVNHYDDFEHDWVYYDANVGQRSTFLNLHDPKQNEICRDLARTADVFVDSFRARKMSEFGFSPEELASIRPGIIVVNVRCYGWDGPWSDRGGFDMLGSAVSGLAILEGKSGTPALPPTAMLNDYITGYIGAAGAAAALLRRAREGGSYQVTVSLTRNAMWYPTLGLIPEADRGKNPLMRLCGDLSPHELPELMRELGMLKQHLLQPDVLIRDTPVGRVRRLAPAVAYATTRSSWREPLLVSRGSCSPEWQ